MMFGALVQRNVKLYFKDKGMFFTSLITPVILLVLYTTFLAKVYRDSFLSAIPVSIEDKLMGALVGGQLISSLLAVSCVTVAFCSNLLMVQDKVSGARKDFMVSPIHSSVLSLSYFVSCLLSTLIVNFAALALCLIYIRTAGWYMRIGDIALIILDVFLLTLFGTALSSCVIFPLHTQGQASAVGTLVSSGYGFICGAYMPISSFGAGLQKMLSFLPGTYGTALLRGHALAGAFRELEKTGLPAEAVKEIKSGIDCTLSFFGHEVGTGAMYGILCGAILLLIVLYLLLCRKGKKS